MSAAVAHGALIATMPSSSIRSRYSCRLTMAITGCMPRRLASIAATNNDDQNIIAAMQAKRLGMQPVMAIVRRQEYRDLIEEEGIVAISAPWATAALVENYLDRPGMAELFEISEGVANLVGVYVPQDAKVVHKAIKDIAVPGECVVAAVVRGKKFVVPRGPTVIEPGDHVIFVGPAAAIKNAQELFREKE